MIYRSQIITRYYISLKDNKCRIIDDSGDYGCYVDVDPNVNCTEYWPFIARDCPRYEWKSCDLLDMPNLEPEPCEERQSWTYQEPAVTMDLADGATLFINFNELSENELESNFGIRSGAFTTGEESSITLILL